MRNTQPCSQIYLRLIISEGGDLLSEMSEGNFRVKTQHEELYVGEYRNILMAMRNINTNLSSTLMEINIAANQVSTGSDQIAGTAQSLSQGGDRAGKRSGGIIGKFD